MGIIAIAGRIPIMQYLSMIDSSLVSESRCQGHLPHYTQQFMCWQFWKEHRSCHGALTYPRLYGYTLTSKTPLSVHGVCALWYKHAIHKIQYSFYFKQTLIDKIIATCADAWWNTIQCSFVMHLQGWGVEHSNTCCAICPDEGWN